MKKQLATVLGVGLMAAGFSAQPAAAATEFGDSCGATDSSIAPITYFALDVASNGLPLAAPSSGVITQFKSTIAMPGSFPHIFRVLRPNGPKVVTIAGEVAGVLATGPNVVAARIPVQAGDRIGLLGTGEAGTVFCKIPGPERLFGGFFGGVNGQSVEYAEVIDEAGIPLAAVVEPDADNDGHGDETQDRCPQNPATQGACPAPPAPPAPVSLKTSSVVKGGLLTVLVTSSAQAPVAVTGSVKLGKGKSAKLNGGTQVVAPGALAKFVLPLPKAVKDKLQLLSRKRTLPVELTATATNPSGSPSISTLKAKLRGQAKPTPKRPQGARG